VDYRCGTIGRVFWARLEDGEALVPCLENLAQKENVDQAVVLVLGALGEGRMVCGPRENVIPPDPMYMTFTQGREIVAIGTIARDKNGPKFHMHAAAGRLGEETNVGCLRAECNIYLLCEAVILEITGLTATRDPDPASGFDLLTFK
jgi:predicted DNA-binding protein with PD1-like motif